MPEPTLDNAAFREWADALPILKRWSDDLVSRAEKHRQAAQRLKNINKFIGGLNVLLAAVTATVMYAALNKKLDDLGFFLQALIIIIALLPAVASGLQREWQVTTREKGHLMLARDCRNLQKQLEFKLAFPPPNLRESLAAWHERYTEVIARPVVPVS